MKNTIHAAIATNEPRVILEANHPNIRYAQLDLDNFEYTVMHHKNPEIANMIYGHDKYLFEMCFQSKLANGGRNPTFGLYPKDRDLVRRLGGRRTASSDIGIFGSSKASDEYYCSNYVASCINATKHWAELALPENKVAIHPLRNEILPLELKYFLKSDLNWGKKASITQRTSWDIIE